jgi:hypothetical protein
LFAASDLPFPLHVSCAPRAAMLGLLFVSALYSARMGVVASAGWNPLGLGRVGVVRRPCNAVTGAGRARMTGKPEVARVTVEIRR